MGKSWRFFCNSLGDSLETVLEIVLKWSLEILYKDSPGNSSGKVLICDFLEFFVCDNLEDFL